jgi:hypothetical protein
MYAKVKLFQIIKQWLQLCCNTFKYQMVPVPVSATFSSSTFGQQQGRSCSELLKERRGRHESTGTAFIDLISSRDYHTGNEGEER